MTSPLKFGRNDARQRRERRDKLRHAMIAAGVGCLCLGGSAGALWNGSYGIGAWFAVCAVGAFCGILPALEE
jgi:hypothetical protein